MSKGNMLLGYARGSVGDIVFARSKGQQTTKARNRNPNNPRTDSQMTQRAAFSNLVKFYTRGIQNLFKFAFETKASSNSDFNAFMKLNRNKGVLISREGFMEDTYPALGKFLMSRGSLPGIPIKYNSETKDFVIVQRTEVDEPTYGTFLQALSERVPLVKGDIITFTAITANGSNEDNTPTAYPTTREPVIWSIHQNLIDVNSTEDLREATGGMVQYIETEEFKGYCFITTGNANDIQGVCIQMSRKTKRGVLVSTTELSVNEVAQTAITKCQSAEYKQDVLESWRSEPLSILEGGIVNDPITGAVITGIRGLSETKTGLTKLTYTDIGQELIRQPNKNLNFFQLRGKNLHLFDWFDLIDSNEQYEFDQISEENGVYSMNYTGSIEFADWPQTIYFKEKPFFLFVDSRYTPGGKHEINIFLDEACTQRPWNFKDVTTIYVKLKTDIGFNDDSEYDKEMGMYGRFLVHTPTEGHEDEPYYLQAYGNYTSQETGKPYKSGDVIVLTGEPMTEDPDLDRTPFFWMWFGNEVIR